MSLEITQLQSANKNLLPFVKGVYYEKNKTWILDVIFDYTYIKEKFKYTLDDCSNVIYDADGYYNINKYSKIEFSGNTRTLIQFIQYICNKFTNNILRITVSHPILCTNIQVYQSEINLISDCFYLIYSSKIIKNDENILDLITN